MTPREKARELVDKYKPYVYCFLGSGMLTNTINDEVENNNAKKCALIAVDEIMKIIDTNMGERYWQQVRTEIEQL